MFLVHVYRTMNNIKNIYKYDACYTIIFNKFVSTVFSCILYTTNQSTSKLNVLSEIFVLLNIRHEQLPFV
jgi:hypothetical protein